jgi:hypothetical protein
MHWFATRLSHTLPAVLYSVSSSSTRRLGRPEIRALLALHLGFDLAPQKVGLQLLDAHGGKVVHLPCVACHVSHLVIDSSQHSQHTQLARQDCSKAMRSLAHALPGSYACFPAAPPGVWREAAKSAAMDFGSMAMMACSPCGARP